MDANKNPNPTPTDSPPVSQTKPSKNWEDVYRAQTNEIHRLDEVIARLTAEVERLRDACREAVITIRPSALGRYATGLVEQLDNALAAAEHAREGGEGE